MPLINLIQTYVTFCLFFGKEFSYNKIFSTTTLSFTKLKFVFGLTEWGNNKELSQNQRKEIRHELELYIIAS